MSVIMHLPPAVVKNAGESVQHLDVCTISSCTDRAIIKLESLLLTMSALRSTSTRGPIGFQTPKPANLMKSVDAIRTKTDKKCDKCLGLFRLAALLNEVIPHLKQVRLLLSDSSALITHRKKAAADMNKFDIPLIFGKLCGRITPNYADLAYP